MHDALLLTGVEEFQDQNQGVMIFHSLLPHDQALHGFLFESTLQQECWKKVVKVRYKLRFQPGIYLENKKGYYHVSGPVVSHHFRQTPQTPDLL